MCQNTLKEGGYKFSCPSCELVLTFDIVRHVLSSGGRTSEEDLNAVMDRVNQNFLNRPETGIRTCRVCGVNWKRDFTKSRKKKVVCNTCSRNRGRKVKYCWECRREWRGNGYKCGYEDCDWEEQQLLTLANCTTKTIAKVAGCPAVRACPRCGTLIQHEEKCKHMTCKCGCSFCFVCLKEKKGFGLWKCSPHDSTCPIAPRQKRIPNC